jgi:3-deoxy-D-manno-octulosonate 8-phosphate phosphatase (KDO 8-P phosphatase)
MEQQTVDMLKNIRTFIFDVDGVLTSGNVLVTEAGEMLRTVNIKDGYALQHAVKQGYNIAIISGGNSKGMYHRFHGLGISEIYLGQKSKMEAFEKVLSDFGVRAEEVAYIGDDMPDYPVLKLAGLPCCPADAAADILEICQYISPIKGGKGVARNLLEKTMKIQGTWWNEDTHSW